MSDMPLLGHRRPSCPPLILRGGSPWSAVQPHSAVQQLGEPQGGCCASGWGGRDGAGPACGWERGPGAGCRCRGVERPCSVEPSFPSLPFCALLVSVPERRMVFL